MPLNAKGRRSCHLSGVRVEATTMITGPLAGMMLADLGAEVVKVENPKRRDPFRTFRGRIIRRTFSPTTETRKASPSISAANRARKVLLRLIRRADVFIENFRPGVMERPRTRPRVLREGKSAPGLLRDHWFRVHRPLQGSSRLRCGRAGSRGKLVSFFHGRSGDHRAVDLRRSDRDVRLLWNSGGAGRTSADRARPLGRRQHAGSDDRVHAGPVSGSYHAREWLLSRSCGRGRRSPMRCAALTEAPVDTYVFAGKVLAGGAHRLPVRSTSGERSRFADRAGRVDNYLDLARELQKVAANRSARSLDGRA